MATYNFEKLISIYLTCFKCKEDLERYTPENPMEIVVGAGMYHCPKCKYAIIVGEEIRKAG